LLGVLGLFLADVASGLFYRTDEQSKVVVVGARSGLTEVAIVVFPGYIMPGDTLSRAFAPFLPADDALVVVQYAERGVDRRQISANVIAALSRLKPRKVLVYGASMGGMVGKLFLDDYRAAGAPYGKVVFVLDTAPSAKADVRRPPALFSVGCWYRGGLLSSAAWALGARLQPEPSIESDASPSLVQAAHKAGAWSGTPALSTQACFMGRFPPLKQGELSGIVNHVTYLQSSDAADDPLVRISQATTGWRTAMPGLEVVSIRERPGKYHLPLIEYPRATMKAILASAKP
jgi:pimeloyl-ACP methyl ester carboxylesterase